MLFTPAPVIAINMTGPGPGIKARNSRRGSEIKDISLSVQTAPGQSPNIFKIFLVKM